MRDRRRRRRLKLRKGKITAGAALIAITILGWLSSYSGGHVRLCQIPELAGVEILTALMALANSSKPPYKWLINILGMPNISLYMNETPQHTSSSVVAVH
jgi:hypothetical protein